MNVIEVKNIGKKYVLGQQVSIKTLLILLVEKFVNFFKFKNSKATVNNERSEDFWALKDVSFEVRQGEILGIIGTNGSGKSTLLKILSRVTSPTEGSATISGRVSSLLEVGTGFNPELTGRENVYLNGLLLGLSRESVDKKFNDIVKYAGVEKFIDTPIKRYSSGMIVRLGFAVAAHLDSDIMIIDEVLAVGDADFQRKSLARLNEIRRSGKSILFVSHSMELVANLCQRVLWLHQGKIRDVGSPQAVIQNYLKYYDSLRGKVTRERTQSSNLPFVTEFKMLDANCNVVESISVGQPIKFVATVEGLPKDSDSNLNLYLWFENQNGLIVTEINTAWKPEKYYGKGLTDIEVSIPEMLLTPGLFTVNLELRVDHQKADYTLQIFNFFVVASDFYNSGAVMQNRGQLYLHFDVKTNGKEIAP